MGKLNLSAARYSADIESTVRREVAERRSSAVEVEVPADVTPEVVVDTTVNAAAGQRVEEVPEGATGLEVPECPSAAVGEEPDVVVDEVVAVEDDATRTEAVRADLKRKVPEGGNVAESARPSKKSHVEGTTARKHAVRFSWSGDRPLYLEKVPSSGLVRQWRMPCPPMPPISNLLCQEEYEQLSSSLVRVGTLVNRIVACYEHEMERESSKSQMAGDFAVLKKSEEDSRRELAVVQERLAAQDAQLLKANQRLSEMAEAEDKLKEAEADRKQALEQYDKEVARREKQAERYERQHAELIEERERRHAELRTVLAARFERLGRRNDDLTKAQEAIAMWGQVVGAYDAVQQMRAAGVFVPDILVAKVAKDKEEWQRKVDDLSITDLLPGDLDAVSLFPGVSLSAEETILPSASATGGE